MLRVGAQRSQRHLVRAHCSELYRRAPTRAFTKLWAGSISVLHVHRLLRGLPGPTPRVARALPPCSARTCMVPRDSVWHRPLPGYRHECPRPHRGAVWSPGEVGRDAAESVSGGLTWTAPPYAARSCPATAAPPHPGEKRRDGRLHPKGDARRARRQTEGAHRSAGKKQQLKPKPRLSNLCLTTHV